MRLIMVRHGQSMANADKSVYFKVMDHLIELSELGKEQAKFAGAALNKRISNQGALVFVSPYLRARQTWEIINEQIDPFKIYQVKETPLIREQEYKLFENMEQVEEINRAKEAFGTFWYRYKRAESQADTYQRAMTFYLYLKTCHKQDQDVVIIAHEIIIKSLLMIIDDIKVEDMESFKINNCEIVEREI